MADQDPMWRGDLLTRAQALQPMIAASAIDAQRARRVPTPVLDALREAGLMRMAVPRELNGPECDPLTMSCALRCLASADAGIAWCAMIASTTSLTAAYLPRAVATTVYGDPRGISGGVFAPSGKASPVAGGYQLSGHWRWTSGSHHCDWLMGGAVIDGHDTARMLVFPARDARLIDTWHTLGLEATGSDDMVVDALFVPAGFSVSLSTDQPWAAGPLYAFPAFGLLALGIASVALGNAQAALEALNALATRKVPQGGRRLLAERGQVQADYAKSVALLASARLYLEDRIDAAWRGAQASGQLSVTARAQLRLACTHAARTSLEVCRAMMDLGGGSSGFLDSPLQRCLRDAQMMTGHIMVGGPTWELAGRCLFGLESNDPSF